MVLRRQGMRGVALLVCMAALSVLLGELAFIHRGAGDREHVFLMLATPYLLAQWQQNMALSRRMRASLATLATLGFFIKPYFLLLWLAVQAYRLTLGVPWKAVLLAVENMTFLVCGLAYAALCAVFATHYFTDAIPMALAFYNAIGWPMASKWDALVGYATPALIAPAGACMAAGVITRHVPVWARYVIAISLGLVAVYLANQGWRYTRYHYMAAGVLLSMCLGAWWWRVVQQLFAEDAAPRRLLSLVVVALASACALHYTLIPAWRAWQEDAERTAATGHPLEFHRAPEPVEAKVKDMTQRYTFAMLSVDWWASNLLDLGTGQTHALRFDYLTPLPGMVHEKEAHGAFSPEAIHVLDMLAADIQKNQPTLIVIDRSDAIRGLPAGFDIAGFMMQHPPLREALAPYTPIDQVDACTPSWPVRCRMEFWMR